MKVVLARFACGSPVRARLPFGVRSEAASWRGDFVRLGAARVYEICLIVVFVVGVLSGGSPRGWHVL